VVLVSLGFVARRRELAGSVARAVSMEPAGKGQVVGESVATTRGENLLALSEVLAPLGLGSEGDDAICDSGEAMAGDGGSPGDSEFRWGTPR
jgi:hypothetical protein